MRNNYFKSSLLSILFVLPLLFNAQVICTDVNPDITNSGNATLNIDLNNDNTPDFQITSAQSGALSFVVVQGSSIGTNNFVLCSGTNSAAALPLNAPIGSTSTTWAQMNSTNQQMVLVVGTAASGPWAGATDQYLGLALAAGTSTYYGWARFSFSSTSNQYTFKDYAYRSNAGVQILAGESCGSITSPIINMPDSICAGSTITVTAGTGTDVPTSYTWAVPPGVSVTASTASSTAMTFTSAGTSTVILMVTNSSTFGVAIKTIQVKPQPFVSVSPNFTTVCPGTGATLFAVSSGNTFSWSPTVSISSTTTQAVVVNPTVTTIYTVQATLNGCSKNATGVAYVNTSPTSSMVSTYSMCARNFNNSVNQSVVSVMGYTVMPANGWPLTITTTTPTGAGIVTPAPPYLTTNSVVTTTLTLLSTAGCTSQVSTSFSIFANPVLTISPIPSTLCTGIPYTITLAGAQGFNWTSNPPGLPNSSSTLAVITPTANTTFSVFSFAGGFSCKSDTYVRSFSVVPGPSITVSNTMACINQTVSMTASGAASYAWVGPLGPVSSSSVAVVFAGSSEGTIIFTLTATGSNSCTSKNSVSLVIETCNGIREAGRASLSLYPQPVKDKLYIETELNSPALYFIFDASGRQVKDGKLDISGNRGELEVANLANGLYTLKLSVGSSQLIAKFLKVD